MRIPAPGKRLAVSAPFFYGWAIVGVAGAANIARVSSAVEVSTLFLPVLTEEFGWSVTAIASATTMGSIGTALTGPWVGRLVDRFGPRMVVALGGLLVGAGCFALAGMGSLGVFVAAYALVRCAGQGLMLFSTPVAVANWCERRRGTGGAVLLGISAIGLMAAPVAVQYAIETVGWRMAWFALGALAVGLGVIPALLLLVRRPEDVGLAMDGDAEKGAELRTRRPVAESWTVRQALRSRALWLLMASIFFESLVTTGVGFHQMPYYLERGLDSTIGAAVVSTFAVGLAAGSVAFGWLADRASPKALMVAANCALAGIMALLLFVHSAAPAFVFAFGFGMVVGGFMTLPTVLVAFFYGRDWLGSISGVVNVVRGLGLALGPTVAGAFFDLTGRYEPAFITFTALSVAGAALMAAVRRPRRPTSETAAASAGA
ncbi:MAG: MFS transporter [Chloroflexota bacterium]|nr:MFS transporter [Chloroflexota bacterium]